MEYFKNWYDENQKFFQLNDKDIENYLNFIGAFTYNTTKILNSFYYIPFHNDGKQIFEFLKEYVLTMNINFEIINKTIDFSNEDYEYILKKMKEIEGRFISSKFDLHHAKLLIQIAYFCFLVLLEQKCFQELKDYIECENCHKIANILKIKDIIEQKVFNQNQIHIPPTYKENNIRFLLSSWQKNAMVYLDIDPKISNEFKVEETNFQYDGKELKLVLKNKDNFSKYIAVDNYENVTLLNEMQGRYEKKIVIPESNFFHKMIPWNYFEFFISIFQPFACFVSSETNLSNKHIISYLKNIIHILQIQIKNQKKRLSITMEINPNIDREIFQNFIKYTRKEKNISKKKLKSTDMDYFFFLSEEDTILQNVDKINQEDASLYFHSEILIDSALNIYIKHPKYFYKKFKSISSTSSHLVILDKYKKHVEKKNQMDYDTFKKGFMNCLLSFLPRNLTREIEGFLFSLLRFNIISPNYRWRQSNILFNFNSFQLYLPCDEINLKNLTNKFLKYKNTHQKRFSIKTFLYALGITEELMDIFTLYIFNHLKGKLNSIDNILQPFQKKSILPKMDDVSTKTIFQNMISLKKKEIEKKKKCETILEYLSIKNFKNFKVNPDFFS